jgi:sterol 24-C-methyltransferase
MVPGAASPCSDSEDPVRSYYELLGDLFHAAWGDHIHFALFSGTETRDQAAEATERMVARDGGFGPGKCVLDVGSGTGGPAITIAADWDVHVTGVDLVPRHVERARERAAAVGLADRTAFLEADATALPFPDATFDAVYAIESAYHVVDKARFYAECARVLRPGGGFLGTDWLHGDGWSDGRGEELLEPVRRHHAIPSLIGLADLRAHLERCGLEPVVVEDLAARGNVMRNWEPRPEIWPKVAEAARSGPPDALREWRAGARAIDAAARAGALIIGYWHARKPQE